MAFEIQNSGEAHCDANDSEGRLSCMIGCPDIPKNYSAGRLHLLETPFYIPLLNGDLPTVALFSGLRRHAGTPPLAPPGETPVLWAIRGNMIVYPPMIMSRGSANYDVAPIVNPASVARNLGKPVKPPSTTVRFTSDDLNLK